MCEIELNLEEEDKMVVAVIFAGGVGCRMHSKEKPKQFLEMYNKPIIIPSTKKGVLINAFVAPTDFIILISFLRLYIVRPIVLIIMKRAIITKYIRSTNIFYRIN